MTSVRRTRPDPFPELLFFVRSDQYSFVKQGIPAVFLGAGTESSDPKIKPHEIITRWRQNIYHKPQDDMNQVFDFESGAKYARFAFLLGYVVAQKTEKPTWNPGDFFGEHYGKKNDRPPDQARQIPDCRRKNKKTENR
jgi:hypothetical protein